MKTGLTAFVSGTIFAIGLGIGGMTDPGRVIGFLDITGLWDPTLVFVLVGAIGSHFLLARIIRRRPAPVFASSFSIPKSRELDARLIGGSALFGVGWGWSAFAPARQ